MSCCRRIRGFYGSRSTEQRKNRRCIPSNSEHHLDLGTCAMSLEDGVIMVVDSHTGAISARGLRDTPLASPFLSRQRLVGTNL